MSGIRQSISNRLVPRLFTPAVRRFLWRKWYGYLTGRIRKHGRAVTFLNYGYVPPPGSPTLALESCDEPDRPMILLYQRVVEGAALAGKAILEVSCGHGGGSSFIQRYHRPGSFTAIDQNPAAIDYCRARHGHLGILYRVGDAEDLPLPAASLDAVVNVEASHCYPNPPVFYREVHRVLRPAGQFLYADFRPADRAAEVDAGLAAAGFGVLEKEDITPRVVEALRQTTGDVEELIERLAPRFLHRLLAHFAALEGSGPYLRFQNRELVYTRYRLQK
ncbi:MAG: class I SAM-dependent methyltransferase [bacterium]